MHPRRALATFLFVLVGLWTLWGLAPTASSALVAAPVDPGGYGLQSLHGKHGFTYSGSIEGVGPVASSGRIDFDGDGHVSAVYTTSVAGIAFRGAFTGTYSVLDDGTGSIVLNLPWLSLQARGNFVIVDHGNGTFFTSTDAGYSVTGSTTRM
jgi:hypothetical protein